MPPKKNPRVDDSTTLQQLNNTEANLVEPLPESIPSEQLRDNKNEDEPNLEQLLQEIKKLNQEKEELEKEAEAQRKEADKKQRIAEAKKELADLQNELNANKENNHELEGEHHRETPN